MDHNNLRRLDLRKAQAARLNTIRDINRQGMTILLVEQNAAMALSIAHRGYVLETGSIALEGTAAQLSDNADVRRAYLGE